ncbi:MAG: hypothetical protein JKY52_07165 [Flavobacteriales bacterium]|nr:hypothetical protein [Flavobacteriales bacterium]
MLRSLPIFILTAVLCFSALGQSKGYKKYAYTWEAEFPKAQPIAPQFIDEPLVILSEEHFFQVSGVRSSYMKIYIEKRQHIKFLSAEELLDGSHFELPGSFDPNLDNSDVPRNGKDKAPRPKLFDVEVLFFAARIKRSDGTIEDAEIDDKVLMDDQTYHLKTQRALSQSFSPRGARLENNKSFSYAFQILNIQPGDELEIHYKYEIPYDPNWYLFNSKRVFYHGKYPKQDYSFTFNFKKRVGTTFSYNNGAKPAARTEEKEKVTYLFKASNLAGCISETNGRPHLELPYFVYNLNPFDSRFFFQSTTTLESAQLPFWIYLLKLREQYTEFQQRRSEPIIKDKQWKKVRAFMVGTTAPFGKDMLVSKMSALHNTVVDEFDYQQDGAYFAGNDRKLERLGDYTENKTLREISRFKLYVKMFTYLQIPYNTVYFMDKRLGKLGLTYISPIIDNEYAFAASISDKRFYLYPKQNIWGYYINELPFYWENTPALDIEFYNLWSDKIADLNFVTTHVNHPKDNIRVTNVKTLVSLNSNQLSCEANVSLSGQFSTMTRNLYVHNYIDSTLNPQYGRKINYAFIGNDPTTLEPKSSSSQYPFKTSFNLHYAATKMISKEGSNYQISLTDWFPHIVEEQVDTSRRSLRYYPDFQYQDMMNYYFVFADSVDLINKKELDAEIVNSYGTYTVRAEQINPTTILLASEFNVRAAYIEAEDIEDVVAIHTAIARLNKGNLIIAPTQ